MGGPNSNKSLMPEHLPKVKGGKMYLHWNCSSQRISECNSPTPPIFSDDGYGDILAKDSDSDLTQLP